MMRIKAFVGVVALSSLLTACDQEQIDLTTQIDQVEVTTSSIIIGPDNRRRVTGDYNRLNRTVGLLTGKNDRNRNINCTATSLGGSWILTAAHCFYDSNGNKIHAVYFHPGVRERYDLAFDRFEVIEVYHPREYDPQLASLRNTGFDIAVAKVANDSQGRNLSARVGGLGLWGSTMSHGTRMDTYGYPSDKEDYTLYFEENCRVETHNDFLYRTFCDVVNGQSGSPALFFNQSRQAHHPGGVVVAEGKEFNYVVKINPERRRIIDSIRNNQYHFDREDFDEQWDRFKIDREDMVNIFVTNRCSIPIYVAISIYDDEENNPRNNRSVGYYKLQPREHVKIDQTEFSEYFLHVQDDRSRVRIGNRGSTRNLRVSVDGRQQPFERFSVSSWGDYHHRVSNCH